MSGFSSKNLIIIAVLIIVAGLGYAFWPRSGLAPERMCTLEAKLCSDGSYVGRTGPNCEFAACPTANLNLKTFTDPTTGATFSYPEKLSTNYVGAVDWPPKLQIIDVPFTCTAAGTETATAGQTDQETINGKEYCVTRETQGAAGSIYIQYAYAFPITDKVAILTFSLRFPQCVNYDEPKRTECQAEEDSFKINLSSLMGSIAESLKLK